MTIGDFKRMQLAPRIAPGCTPALSMMQPWASLLIAGRILFETRSWRTAYRGRLAIHASKKPLGPGARELAHACGLPADLPLGAVIGTVTLFDCLSTADPVVTDFLAAHPRERILGDFGPRRWAWRCKDARAIEPEPARGQLGIWSWQEVRPR